MGRNNEIVICKKDYETNETFHDAIRDVVKVLLDNNYIMTIRYDDKGLGIVCVDYGYADESYGDYYPRWLSPYEYESIIWGHERGEEDK